MKFGPFSVEWKGSHSYCVDVVMEKHSIPSPSAMAEATKNLGTTHM